MAYRDLKGKNGYVYILSNYARSVLYIGVTSDLVRRVGQHRAVKGAAFSKKYNTKYLLYYEEYPNIGEALEREKQLKNWHREWKFNLIKEFNPEMYDLWGTFH